MVALPYRLIVIAVGPIIWLKVDPVISLPLPRSTSAWLRRRLHRDEIEAIAMASAKSWRKSGYSSASVY